MNEKWTKNANCEQPYYNNAVIITLRTQLSYCRVTIPLKTWRPWLGRIPLFNENSSHDSMKCLETLATNSEKAGLVHFLNIEYNTSATTPRNTEEWRVICQKA